MTIKQTRADKQKMALVRGLIIVFSQKRPITVIDRAIRHRRWKGIRGARGEDQIES